MLPYPTAPIARVVNLIPDEDQRLLGLTAEEARRLLFAADPAAALGIGGSFALVVQDGERVRLARSLDRPLRYFLAKQAAGPVLVVADRIDAISGFLEEMGAADQFHPTYTRMVPAHHVTEIAARRLPRPQSHLPPLLRSAAEASCRRTSTRSASPTSSALYAEIRLWLAARPRAAHGRPLLGRRRQRRVLLALYHELLRPGESRRPV